MINSPDGGVGDQCQILVLDHNEAVLSVNPVGTGNEALHSAFTLKKPERHSLETLNGRDLKVWVDWTRFPEYVLHLKATSNTWTTVADCSTEDSI